MPKDLCTDIGVLCARRCVLVGVLAWLLTAVTGVEAQTVTLNARVSETVNLSVDRNSTQGDIRVHVVSSGNTVRMTLSGHGEGSIRVPLMVRSNTGFKISGRFESTTAQITQLSVLNARATGGSVSSEAINNLEVSPRFDLRGSAMSVFPEGLDFSSPFFVFSGPRISLGGTLVSPNNALQVTFLIRIKSESVADWVGYLTFSND
jgi:hypothetical protein